MKRHSPDAQLFALLKMLDDFALSKGMSIKDELTVNKFIEQLSEAVQKHRDNPMRIHGFRVESMFAHIAAALGKCLIITEEDSGVLFSAEENIIRPDFRIITIDHEQFFVEVKNYHQNDPMEAFTIKATYLNTLKKYADIFNIPLKIAIFWSRWKLWTLVDVTHFISDKSEIVISMSEAMKKNEMNLLGDHMIGTVPPLSLRIYADKNKPRSVDKNGQVYFTIGNVAFYANGQEIVDKFEKKLVWFFMMHGKWEQIDQPAEVKDGLLEYTEFSVSPEQYDKKQGFAILGSLSELITSNYKLLTSPEGDILQLTPKQQPDQLSILIPYDYKGKDLKLWRFHVQPNYDDVINEKR